MRTRFLVAISTALLCVGPAWAQDPARQCETVTPIMSELGWIPSGSERWTFSADYLAAFVRGTNLPPLVTTATPGTARANAGILGQPSTSILFGDSWENQGLRSGFRLGAQGWLGAERRFGLDMGFTMLESQATLFSAASTDGTILGRPYNSTNSGQPEAVLVAFPGLSNGAIDVRAASGNFYSLHLAVTEKAVDLDWLRVTAIFGYRFYRYDESLRITQVIAPTDPNFVPGTEITSNDLFSTHNVFHGGDLGFRTQFFWDRFSLDLLTKVAVGRVFREVNIGGDQVTAVPGLEPVSKFGGVYALSPNSGTFGSRDWKVMPEFTATLAWQIRPNVTARVGYSFILLNGVMRAADQVDQTINPNLFPGGSGVGPLVPLFPGVRSDVWVQSVNFGLEFVY